MDAEQRITVVLVDDHEVVRHGLRSMLRGQRGVEVVGEAATAADAVRVVADTRPAVAIVDSRLPDGRGADLCRQIRTQYPDTCVLLLAASPDLPGAVAAVHAGAAGYVSKETPGHMLAMHVRQVASGHTLAPLHSLAEALRQGGLLTAMTFRAAT